MRRILLLMIIGVGLTFKVDAKKIEGKIIFKNDTLDVVFSIPTSGFARQPNFERLQYKVKYFDTSGRKVTLRPDDAIEIRFNYKDENVRMLSRLNSPRLGNMFSKSNNIFLLLETDGKLKLFKYYYTENSPEMYSSSTDGFSYSVEKYILQINNDPLKRPVGITFKKEMADYFSDCPALKEKIESKYFRKRDLASIVRYYNSNCQ